jgi:ascorbate-specific PTS system EIIC-type component UlaA
MGGEVFQAQVIRNFFETITGTDRNLTRIYMCVISLAKLRMENPEKVSFLVDQMKRSKQQRELSIDILDYMCDAAIQLDMNVVQTAFGVKTIIGEVMQDFNGISLDTL